MTTHTLNLVDSDITNTTRGLIYIDFLGNNPEIVIPPGATQKEISGRLSSVRNDEVQLQPLEPVQTIDAEPGAILSFAQKDPNDPTSIEVYFNNIPIEFKRRVPQAL